jgi:flagellar protein FliO/FliZ
MNPNTCTSRQPVRRGKIQRALFCLSSILLTICTPALAEEVTRPAYVPIPPPAVSSGSIVQVIFSLLLVLAAILLVAWLFKRMNVTQKGNANLLKVLGGVSIGQRERVVLVEIEDTWLVVGVGPGQIRTLHTLPKSASINQTPGTSQPEVPFSAWLKKVIEKRDAS